MQADADASFAKPVVKDHEPPPARAVFSRGSPQAERQPSPASSLLRDMCTSPDAVRRPFCALFKAGLYHSVQPPLTAPSVFDVVVRCTTERNPPFTWRARDVEKKFESEQVDRWGSRLSLSRPCGDIRPVCTR